MNLEDDIMSYRYVNVNKLKSKRKKNQYINELIRNYCPDLMISKKEFKRIHKKEIVNIFEQCGYNYTTEMYVTDCIVSTYWYKDPVCYKTVLNNLNYLEFDNKFDELFGKDMKYNKVFITKMKRLNNSRICS